jgi:cytidyltransferase-like protein
MKIGFVNGCFDGLHEGHKYFLREASAQCTYLIVAVNSDRWVSENKGSERPLHSLEERVFGISRYLRHCFAVVSFDSDDPDLLIAQIKPQIVIRGWDQQGSFYCEATHIPVHRVPRLGNYSTTLLAHG